MARRAAPYPERLFSRRCRWVVDLAVDEMRRPRARDGGFHAAEPVSRQEDDQRPDVQAVLGDGRALDFSISFRGLTTAMPAVGVDRFEEDRAAPWSRTWMMLVALSVIWGGSSTAIRELHRVPRVGRRLDRAVSTTDGPT
jgi:hypothetical protein